MAVEPDCPGVDEAGARHRVQQGRLPRAVAPDDDDEGARVDLEIDAGAFVIVIGGNGSGKSTLLNAVAGTCLVDAGTIRLDGHDLTRWPEYRQIGRASCRERVEISVVAVSL